jgi:hypothetical protein
MLWPVDHISIAISSATRRSSRIVRIDSTTASGAGPRRITAKLATVAPPRSRRDRTRQPVPTHHRSPRVQGRGRGVSGAPNGVSATTSSRGTGRRHPLDLTRSRSRRCQSRAPRGVSPPQMAEGQVSPLLSPSVHEPFALPSLEAEHDCSHGNRRSRERSSPESPASSPRQGPVRTARRRSASVPRRVACSANHPA